MSAVDGWKIVQFSEILEVIRNGFSGRQHTDISNYPVSRIETIAEGYVDLRRVGYVKSLPASYLLREGDLLFSNINSVKHIGKIAQVTAGQRLYHGMNLLVFRLSSKVDSKFLYYVLVSKKHWFESMSAQAVNQASINQETIKGLKLEIPDSPSEQAKIAEVLSTVDRAIEQTEALIAKQQRIKTGLMQDLLTRGIDEDGNLRSEETHEFKDSPLGRIPVEWEVSQLGSLTSKIADRDHSTPKYVHDGVLIISPMAFYGDEGIDFEKCPMISRKAHQRNSQKTDSKPGDLIIHRIGAGLGRVREVLPEHPIYSLLHSLALIRPLDGKACTNFLKWSIRDRYVQMQMGVGIQSIGVPDLGLEKIASFLIKHPESLAEQQLISDAFERVGADIRAAVEKLDKLKHLKTALMQDLLTGKVRVNALLNEEDADAS